MGKKADRPGHKRSQKPEDAAAEGDAESLDTLGTLLERRYHGASNIRGIRFQLRYSMLRAVELALESSQSQHESDALGHHLTFEGIEDLDINALNLKPIRINVSPRLEFPGFSGDVAGALYEPLRIALG